MLQDTLILSRKKIACIQKEISPVTAILLDFLAGYRKNVAELRMELRGLYDLKKRMGSRMAMPVSPDSILELRSRLHLPQKILGRFLGVSRVTVGHWEHGKTSPLLEQRYLIHEMVNTAIEDLETISNRDRLEPSSTPVFPKITMFDIHFYRSRKKA